MKINGTPWKQFEHGTAYIVVLKGGPFDGHKSIAMNTRIVWHHGERYELNADGDYCHAPEGLN